MRIANLIRRTLPTTPLRAGIPPTWDRPDPPSSVKVPRNRRLTMEEKHFSFFDGASPTYMLVNSEVAEGDVIEAFPLFAKRIGIWILTAFFIGATGYIWSTNQSFPTLYNYSGQVEHLQTQLKHFESKYGLKDLQNNPWKLNSWPQIFPAHQMGVQSLSTEYAIKTKAVDSVRKINKDGLVYWNKLYAQAKEELKSGKGGHH